MLSCSNSSTGAGSCGITHNLKYAMDGFSCLNDPFIKGILTGSVVNRPK
jgi:hypothetical protein